MMRTLIFSFLTAALLFPPGMALAGPEPTSAEHPAFAELRKAVETNDRAGVPVEPGSGTMVPTNDLQQAISNPNIGAGCNPVVWAALVQGARMKVNQEVAAKSELTQQINLKNNNCLNLAQNRTEYVQSKRQLTTKINSAFSNLLSAITGGLLDPDKIADIARQFNLDPAKFLLSDLDNAIATQCVQLDKTRNNLFANANGDFGTALLNQSANKGALTVKLNNVTAQPPVNNTNKKAVGVSNTTSTQKSAVQAPTPAQPRAAPTPAPGAKPQSTPKPAPSIYN